MYVCWPMPMLVCAHNIFVITFSKPGVSIFQPFHPFFGHLGVKATKGPVHSPCPCVSACVCSCVPLRVCMCVCVPHLAPHRPASANRIYHKFQLPAVQGKVAGRSWTDRPPRYGQGYGLVVLSGSSRIRLSPTARYGPVPYDRPSDTVDVDPIRPPSQHPSIWTARQLSIPNRTHSEQLLNESLER